MRRYLIVLACVIFLKSAVSFASESQDPQRSPDDRQAPTSVSASSRRKVEPTISIKRLRVPDKVRNLYGKALRAFRKHKYVEAQAKLDQAPRVYPDFPEALALSGSIYINLAHWDLAEQTLRGAICSDPTYEAGYRLLSDLYNREKRFDDAMAVSQRAIGIAPESWPLRYELARALIGKHEYGAALRTVDASLRKFPATLLRVARAHTLLGLGRYPEAAAELRAYLQFAPRGDGSQDAQSLLAQIQSAIGAAGQ